MKAASILDSLFSGSASSESKPEKSSEIIDLKDYLVENALQESMPLSSDGNVVFHWGDWKESCNFQRDLLLQGDHKQKERFEGLEQMLEELKHQPVWVNNKVKTTQMTLHDLYRSYLDPRIKQIWFTDYESRFLVSLSGETGPYVPLGSMRWFERDLFACFVYRRILTQDCNNRNFRLGLASPIICHFEDKTIDTHHVSIHQLTSHGILFKIDGFETFNKILVSENIRLEFNLGLFKQLAKARGFKEMQRILQNESSDLSYHNKRSIYELNIKDVVTKYGNLENFKISNSKDFFFYLSWKDLKTIKSREKEEISELMPYFIGALVAAFNAELE